MLFLGNWKGCLDPNTRFMRLFACGIVLTVMFFAARGLIALAAADGPPAETTAPVAVAPVASVAPSKERGKITDVADGLPAVTIGKDGDESQKVRVPANVVVEINGYATQLSELQSGDDCTLTKDGTGAVTKISASRLTPGMVVEVSPTSITVSADLVKKETYPIVPNAPVLVDGQKADVSAIQKGDDSNLLLDRQKNVLKLETTHFNLPVKFWNNFRSNLFKPLLLFFYVGFCIPLLRVAFEFPKPIYQGLTIYLLVSIGWHGGEELAVLSSKAFQQAFSFMAVGFFTNSVIALIAYFMLRIFVPKLRKIDAATVSAYYGSDSAGTFVTCVGVLQAAHIAFAPYMPVMLAIMEIPGCLVGLLLVMSLRNKGMDRRGNMPGEPSYKAPTAEEVGANAAKKHSWGHVLHEIFFNAGSFLLFGGILIGFFSRLQGLKVVQADDALFISLFQGFLCLFLLEMGMTASRRLQDLRSVNWTYIAFGIIAPNVFALFGLCVAQVLSHALHQPFQLGTYTLFAVLCAAASYIAVPAVQRLAIPEASPSLPLAASLGLTFPYNVTIGIPLYMIVAQVMMRSFPVS